MWWHTELGRQRSSDTRSGAGTLKADTKFITLVLLT
jgi:hypothetical protein